MKFPKPLSRTWVAAVLTGGWLALTGIGVYAGNGETVPAVTAGKGWRYSVFQVNLTEVDNLVRAADGTLYATLELGHGEGRLVRIRHGRVDTLVGGLNRPDGLLLHGKYLYLTEEVPEGRVLRLDLDGGSPQVLATLHNPEGIEMLRNGNLVVSEDSVNGRLVEIHKNGTVEVVIGGLNRPEGVAVAKDGTIYIAETGTGRLLAYKRGVLTTVVDDLDGPDQVELAPDGALWISEDSKPGRVLRFKNGTLETVVFGVLAPQGIVLGPNDSAYVAEQGRHRILLIQRAEN